MYQTLSQKTNSKTTTCESTWTIVGSIVNYVLIRLIDRNSGLQFDKNAEKRLRRKIDLHIVPLVAVLYLFCFIDRSNIGNARLANFEEDLGLQGNDYNLVLSVFYISYALFEIPATLLCKIMGPGWFIPLTTFLFGICTVGTAFANTKGRIIACRLLLGIFESGMLPGIAYYLSRWYRRAELAFRLGMYIVMAPLSGAFGGLLASGILSLDRVGSLKEWRMIFGVEGIITIGLSLVTLALLTDNPNTARWLNEEEKTLALDRVKSERVAQDRVLDKVNAAKLKRGILNPITLSTGFIFLLSNVVVLGISFFLPTIIRTIYPDQTRVHQQLLTVPPYIVASFCFLLVSWLATVYDTRQIFLFLSGPLVMVGYAILLKSTDPTVRYAAIFLTASCAFFGGSLSNAQVSANTDSDTARNIAISTNGVFGYLGGLIATWTYLPWDGPMYPIGNGLNLAVSAVISITSLTFLWWMKMDNKRRDEKTPAEREEELSGLTREQISDLDWKHPDFRWRP
ncbi:major facilitator superfamily transporter [Ilyonectria robusta]|uniref:major facilitator superfamily transporter n=1 Tax=Ilyonectria robusta TaxID=1079257 RepID=UPI001E8ED76F|nr:major facilitator superfamily transporter [Ilyonectria robusta]KAH8656830.1 major facilitator superfamily transporter [Ilyonectria robusta]